MLVFGGSVWASSTGCSRERAHGENAPEDPEAIATGPQASEYELTSGAAEIVFGPATRPWRGHLPISHGRLWLDLAELGATRAVLTFDLAGLVVDETSGRETSSLVVPSRTL